MEGAVKMAGIPAGSNMPGTITLGVDAKVTGEKNLTRLERRLQGLKKEFDALVASQWDYAEAQQIVAAQTRNEIQAMKNSNTMLKAKSKMTDKQLRSLAVEQRAEKQYTAEFERRMAEEQRALEIQHQSKTDISNEKARLMAKEQMAEEQLAIATKARMRETSQALMRASISMFVLNISMGQLANSMKPFVEGNEDAEKALKDMTAALQFMMAPLQTFMALQMISKSLTDEQKVAFLGVASAMGAMFFWYQAITAQSPGMRAAYAAIATVLTAVAIASWAAATGMMALEGAFGIPLGAIAVIGALTALAAATAYITAPKGQTLTGHRKGVRKGGMAILDDDEVITREPKGTRGGAMGGGGDTIIYLPDSYTGSMSDAKITANSVRRLQNSGYGSVKFRRKVIASG